MLVHQRVNPKNWVLVFRFPCAQHAVPNHAGQQLRVSAPRVSAWGAKLLQGDETTSTAHGLSSTFLTHGLSLIFIEDCPYIYIIIYIYVFMYVCYVCNVCNVCNVCMYTHNYTYNILYCIGLYYIMSDHIILHSVMLYNIIFCIFLYNILCVILYI
jgi:hypothetical protein